MGKKRSAKKKRRRKPGAAPAPAKPTRPPEETVRPRRLPRWLIWGGVVVCVVLVGTGIVLWRLWRSPRREPRRGVAVVEPVPSADNPMFTDVTGESGITFRHSTGDTRRLLYPEIMGSGVALLDYDGDGDLDIYFLNGNYLRGKSANPKLTNVLYRNEGDWRFTDVTYEAGVADASYSQGAEAADFDNDGDVDLYVTNVGPNVYFRNEGNGTFTRTSLLADPRWGQCCSALDYDCDGDLDLYLVNYLDYDAETALLGTIMVAGKLIHDYQGPQNYEGSPDSLFRNNGDGTFTDVTREAGLYQPGGKGMGLACADFDNDGRPDVFVSNDFMINYLFLNEGKMFRETGLLWGVALDGNGQTESFMGVDVADVDDDGRLDILIPCLGRESFNLFHNEGSVFSDISHSSGLYDATHGHTGFSPSFLDFDNDGDKDVFVTCGRVLSSEEPVIAGKTGFAERYAQTDLLLENDGRGGFRRVADRAGPHFKKVYVARGSAVGDLDNDGDVDVVINNSAAPPVLLRNDTKGGHWLTVRLIGTESNRDAIGARVVARVGDRVQHYYVRGGGSYLSVSDRRVHIGLGEPTVADSIEIVWPSGAKQVLEKVAANQFLSMEEPAS